MQKQEIKGEQPDYRGKLDVSAWLNTDKNGKKYLSVTIGSRVHLFKNEQKVEDIFE